MATMDIFSTIIDGCGIIYNFIESYAAASDQSRSLAARLNWDLRVLQQFAEYYESRVKADGSELNKLSTADKELLDTSVAYLAGLATKVTTIAERLQTKNRFRKELNKAMWWHREDEVQEIEKELFEWTSRLDLRLVGLPSEWKTVIKLDAQAIDSAPNFAASIQIENLKKVTLKADQTQLGNDTIFRESMDDVDAAILSMSQKQQREQFLTTESSGKQLLVERRFHEHPQKSPAWNELKESIEKLARAMHCLDGTTVSLLHCSYVFHDAHDPVRPNFALVHSLPFTPGAAPETLKALINKMQGKVRLPAAHPLHQRFQIAQSVASAIYFLHGVGFLHHSVTAHNVLLVERTCKRKLQRFPHSLGVPFLVGFGAVKEIYTASDGHQVATSDMLYQHPDRLEQTTSRPKYNAAHDLYSLGMVLLELGMWKPLERYSKELLSQSTRNEILQELLRLVEISMGSRYRKVIQWCLERASDETVDALKLSREVVEPLEEMTSALR